eukprot:9247401-Pyramimonas_sp.AAC.1
MCRTVVRFASETTTCVLLSSMLRSVLFAFLGAASLLGASFRLAPLLNTAAACVSFPGVSAARSAMHSPRRCEGSNFLAFFVAFLRHRHCWAVSRSAWRRRRGTVHSGAGGASPLSGTEKSSDL